MTTKNPRIQVTLNPIEHEIVKILAKKKHVSMSVIAKKFIEKALEDYEDEMDIIALNEARIEENLKNALPWEDVVKKLGWDNL